MPEYKTRWLMTMYTHYDPQTMACGGETKVVPPGTKLETIYRNEKHNRCLMKTTGSPTLYGWMFLDDAPTAP